MFDTKQFMERTDSLIENDEGNLFDYLQSVAISKVILQKDNFANKELKRIGGSEIGEDCERKLWYSYNKFSKKPISARIRRLFLRGKWEEARCIAYLQLGGFTVWADNGFGEQFSFELPIKDGMISGHADGIGGYDGSNYLLEFKTHSTKLFKTLEKGVKISFPKHYAQCQCYMRELKLNQAVYMAVNKDTDEIHLEVIPYDDLFAQNLIDKATRIIMSAEEETHKCSIYPSYFECKWCDFYKDCWNIEV